MQVGVQPNKTKQNKTTDQPNKQTNKQTYKQPTNKPNKQTNKKPTNKRTLTTSTAVAFYTYVVINSQIHDWTGQTKAPFTQAIFVTQFLSSSELQLQNGACKLPAVLLR